MDPQIVVDDAALSKARAGNLLIQLAGLGFSLEVRKNILGVSPRGKLPDYLRRAIKENEKMIRSLLPNGRPAKRLGKASYVCDLCDLPRPGQSCCPKCSAEREWLERKRL